MEIAAYQDILSALADTALGEGESRELIATLATELYARIERIMMTAPEPDHIVWRTSSYTGTNGACVEVGWRTSSYSNGGAACVEVAPAPDAVLVRDSKHRTGPPSPSPPSPGKPSSPPSPADQPALRFPAGGVFDRGRN